MRIHHTLPSNFAASIAALHLLLNHLFIFPQISDGQRINRPIEKGWPDNTAFFNRVPGRCGRNEFDCGTIYQVICIPLTKFRDGIPDCRDMSDEWCFYDQVRCGHQCIRTADYDPKDCVGKKTCQEDIDGDRPFFCELSKQKLCGYNTTAVVPCRGYGECILRDWLLDGKADCIDESDEDMDYAMYFKNAIDPSTGGYLPWYGQTGYVSPPPFGVPGINEKINSTLPTLSPISTKSATNAATSKESSTEGQPRLSTSATRNPSTTRRQPQTNGLPYQTRIQTLPARTTVPSVSFMTLATNGPRTTVQSTTLSTFYSTSPISSTIPAGKTRTGLPYPDKEITTMSPATQPFWPFPPTSQGTRPTQAPWWTTVKPLNATSTLFPFYTTASSNGGSSRATSTSTDNGLPFFPKTTRRSTLVSNSSSSIISSSRSTFAVTDTDSGKTRSQSTVTVTAQTRPPLTTPGLPFPQTNGTNPSVLPSIGSEITQSAPTSTLRPVSITNRITDMLTNAAPTRSTATSLIDSSLGQVTRLPDGGAVESSTTLSQRPDICLPKALTSALKMAGANSVCDCEKGQMKVRGRCQAIHAAVAKLRVRTICGASATFNEDLADTDSKMFKENATMFKAALIGVITKAKLGNQIPEVCIRKEPMRRGSIIFDVMFHCDPDIDQNKAPEMCTIPVLKRALANQNSKHEVQFDPNFVQASNPCVMGLHNCQQNQMCGQPPNVGHLSYRCACKQGFRPGRTRSSDCVRSPTNRPGTTRTTKKPQITDAGLGCSGLDLFGMCLPWLILLGVFLGLLLLICLILMCIWWLCTRCCVGDEEDDEDELIRDKSDKHSATSKTSKTGSKIIMGQDSVDSRGEPAPSSGPSASQNYSDTNQGGSTNVARNDVAPSGKPARAPQEVKAELEDATSRRSVDTPTIWETYKKYLPQDNAQAVQAKGSRPPPTRIPRRQNTNGSIGSMSSNDSKKSNSKVRMPQHHVINETKEESELPGPSTPTIQFHPISSRHLRQFGQGTMKKQKVIANFVPAKGGRAVVDKEKTIAAALALADEAERATY